MEDMDHPRLLPEDLDALRQFDALPGHFFMLDNHFQILFYNKPLIHYLKANNTNELMDKPLDALEQRETLLKYRPIINDDLRLIP